LRVAAIGVVVGIAGCSSSGDVETDDADDEKLAQDPPQMSVECTTSGSNPTRAAIRSNERTWRLSSPATGPRSPARTTRPIPRETPFWRGTKAISRGIPDSSGSTRPERGAV